jgi:hypothetical protein
VTDNEADTRAKLLDPVLTASLLADAQPVGHAVDVVEPAGDQVDLQDGPVVEADTAEAVEILGRDLPAWPGPDR